MFPRRLALALALAGGAMAVAESCSPVTEVVVVVDGDVAGADTVTLRIETSSGFSEEKTARLSDVRLPLTLGVHAGDDESSSFTVEAKALRGSDVVVSRKMRARLVSGESRVLVVSLCSSCAGVSCQGEQTCIDGSCARIADEPSLPEWTGGPPPYRCGAADGPLEIIDGVYHRIDDARNWSGFDLRSISPDLFGYVGAAFDGTFVYLAPYQRAGVSHGQVVRYDSAKSFTDKASWTSFDLTTVDPGAIGYAAAATFKTDYVYFIPNAPGSDVLARYKVGAPFTDPTSWSMLHLSAQATTTGTAALGGAVVNFSHVWMPSRDVNQVIILHDERIPDDPIDGGWAKVSPQLIDAGMPVPGGLFGGAFDLDHRMYFAPSRAGTKFHGVALMRDINAAGGDATAGWSAFDIATLHPNARGYAGAVFDGQFVTFVPLSNEVGEHGLAARVDTRKPFADPASWELFNLGNLHPELFAFYGGVFDGRFVYLVPAESDKPRLWLVRFDTKGGFTDPNAWSRFDLKLLPGMGDPSASFHGAAFDGKYVYLVPSGYGPVLRFDARETPDKNAGQTNGSFL